MAKRPEKNQSSSYLKKCDMGKIIFSLFVCLFLFGSHAEGSSSTTVNLWQSEQHVIQGILSEEWRPLAAE